MSSRTFFLVHSLKIKFLSDNDSKNLVFFSNYCDGMQGSATRPKAISRTPREIKF